MQPILDTIAQFFNGILGNPIIQLSFQLAGIYVIVLWLATAYWAYRDLVNRTSNPVLPYLAAALVIIFTPVFFVFAVIAYRIIRPRETMAEANERALAEEAMLVEVEQQAHCANCHRRVERDWIICPTCRNRLRRVCPNCSRMVELDWTLCAWCGKDFERPELLREGMASRALARPRSAAAPELARPRSAAAPEMADVTEMTDVTEVTPTRRAAARPR